MRQELYRFHLNPEVPVQAVKDTLLLSLLAIESLHGRSRVKLDVRVAHNKAEGICEIDASTHAGSDMARIFTGYAVRKWGNRSVRVERISRRPDTLQKHRYAAAPGVA